MMEAKITFGIFLVFLAFVYSCNSPPENEELNCGTIDPFTELTWLSDIKRTIEIRASAAGAQIIQYKYEGNYVFWIEDPCCDNETPQAKVYNCEGELICSFDGEGNSNCPIFKDLATDSTMLLDYVQH